MDTPSDNRKSKECKTSPESVWSPSVTIESVSDSSMVISLSEEKKLLKLEWYGH